ncbi:MAG: hypothetical protein D4R72_07755 [Nitrosopumilales archaeon]|nr:MAG: hypothetical protein D4R72_07755 [Nitrosopumilales archaeon]
MELNRKKIDPHHCRCFSISKLHFRNFKAKLQNFGFSEPLFEEDHHQILGLTKPIYQYYQIHVKLMRTGRIEAEIEYPQDYPMAHLNPTHSFPAHAELNSLLNDLQITYKCKRIPPITCVQRQIIPAQNPTHKNTFYAIGGVGALADLIFNDGKVTSAVLNGGLKEIRKSIRRKLKRRRFLN